MARLFQITRLSSELMPTTSVWWCIDSSREILPWPYPRYRVERGKRFTNERTKEQDSAPVRLCAEEETRRGGSSPAQPLIHHADTRLTTSFQIYRVYQPCLISRNVFTTPYSKGCFPPSTFTHAAPVSLWIVLECKNLEGYKLLSIITSMDKPVSRDATNSRMPHLRPRNFSFVTHLSISWRRSF